LLIFHATRIPEISELVKKAALYALQIPALAVVQFALNGTRSSVIPSCASSPV